MGFDEMMFLMEGEEIGAMEVNPGSKRVSELVYKSSILLSAFTYDHRSQKTTCLV